jgi:3-deoxy-manno-octulosonate cytidylyltransferase (CMP-KDO synthetase)
MLPFLVHALAEAKHAAPVVVAIIPARYQSSRLPGKPLAPLAGRPLIEHVYRRVSRVPEVSRVLVAADDDRVAAAVEGFGGACVMTDTGHRSGTDRLAEVARGLSCDIVVNVQGDEPLLEPDMVSALLTAFDDPAVEMATLRRPLASAAELTDPNVVKVVVDARGDALYFSRAPIPWARDAADHLAPGHTFKHLGVYAYRRTFLLRFAALPQTGLEIAESLEQLRALEHGYRIRTVETLLDSVGVDTPADLARVREHLETPARAPRDPRAAASPA